MMRSNHSTSNSSYDVKARSPYKLLRRASSPAAREKIVLKIKHRI